MVGEISNWPRGRHAPKADWQIMALMYGVLAGVVTGVLFEPDDKSEMLPQVVGCYMNYRHQLATIADRRSVVRADGLTIPVTVQDQKWGGVRLWPARTVDYATDGNSMRATAGAPWQLILSAFTRP